MLKPFQTTIQDLVYNIDAGVGLRIIRISLYVLGVFLIMLLYTATQFKGLKSAEAMDYAQLGRNLATGSGYSTKYIRPLSVWHMRQKTPEQNPRLARHPELMKPPLYPAVLSAFFRVGKGAFDSDSKKGVFRAEQWILIPVNHAFTLASGFFVLLIGRKLFGTKMGLLAISLFYLSDAIWAQSIAGHGQSMAGFFCMGAFFFIYQSALMLRAGKVTPRSAVLFAAGTLFTILAVYTRYAAWAAVPGLALLVALILPTQKRWVFFSIFLGAVLLAFAPWLVRNKMIGGSFSGLVLYECVNGVEDLFAGNVFNELSPDFTLQEVMRNVQMKWLTNIRHFYSQDLRTVGEGLMGAFFLAVLFYRFIRRDVEVFKWSIVLSLVVLFLAAGLFGSFTLGFTTVFSPLITIFGLAFFQLLVDRLDIRLRLVDIALTILIILTSAFPLIMTIVPPRASVPYPPYFHPYVNYVSDMIEPEELLCTDMPWATAWYGHKNSLELPKTIDEFYEFNDFYARISGLYFTTLTRNLPYIRELRTGAYRTWFPVLEGRLPRDFPLSKGIPLNNMDQLFLTDYPRWQKN